MNERLYELIDRYQPQNEQERADRSFMLEIIRTYEDVATRNNRLAHFSASPWIVNQDFTKVLMVYHHIYDSWGWCGGHLDGEDDCLYVARKEGMEESGLSTLRSLSPEPITIDILPVPPHFKNGHFVSAHVHLNITYLCMADERAALRIKPDENSGVKWIANEQINDEVSEKEMCVVYDKLMRRSQQIFRTGFF